MNPFQKLEELKTAIAEGEKKLSFARQTISAVEAAWPVCWNAFELSKLIFIRHTALRMEQLYLRALSGLYRSRQDVLEELLATSEEPQSAVA